MTRPPSPQFVETDQGDWSWTWRTTEGIEPFTVEHEIELEWLRAVERWQVRSRYDPRRLDRPAAGHRPRRARVPAARRRARA